MLKLKAEIIKAALVSNNCESNDNVVRVYYKAIADAPKHEPLDDIAYDNDIDLTVLTYIYNNYKVRGIKF